MNRGSKYLLEYVLIMIIGGSLLFMFSKMYGRDHSDHKGHDHSVASGCKKCKGCQGASGCKNCKGCRGG